MTQPVTFNPGPSQLLPGLADDLADALRDGVASMSHRSSAFGAIFRRARNGVRSLMELPDDHEIVFASSGTEVMEILVRNLTTSSATTFHACAGAFSRRFREVSERLGRRTAVVEVPPGCGMELDAIHPPEAELACLTHVETSTGVELDLSPLAAWRPRASGACIAVDVVSSAPTRRLPWEHADAWFFSVQKAWGLPAGLAVVVLGPRARERAAALASAGADQGYVRRLVDVLECARADRTIETPNVLGLHILACGAARLLDTGGLRAVEDATRKKAEALYAWLEGSARLRPFVTEPSHRARTVASVRLPDGADAERLSGELASRGLTVGAGYGELRRSQIRIANYPAHAPADHARLMAAIDELC